MCVVFSFFFFMFVAFAEGMVRNWMTFQVFLLPWFRDE